MNEIKQTSISGMKLLSLLSISILVFAHAQGQTQAQQQAFTLPEKQFQYLSPWPGSIMNSLERSIIIRAGSEIEFSSLTTELFSLRGSKNGAYEFGIVLAKDGKTILLNPTAPFAYGEDVSVSVKPGIKTKDGGVIPAYSFSFNTHREYTAEEQQKFKELRAVTENEEIKEGHDDIVPEEESDTRDIAGMFEITTNNNPSAGDIFFNALSSTGALTPYNGIHVVNSDGDSIFSRAIEYPGVFQQTSNGNFAVFNGDQTRFDILDSNFNVIDKYYPASGYDLDNHELLMLTDGHVLMIALEYQVIDMTVYDPGYSPNASLEGTVIQEFDEDKNLIFEWRSFDHIGVTEALHANLASSFIDYIHTNSLEIDNDGNILASHRHLDQITKIDRNTGEFIWRLGGVENEFAFINEPQPFTYQHDCRRISNGNITLFDNGNHHSPQRSFAKEYTLDEINKTATLVWSYSHPDVNGKAAYYFAMGSVQRLDNGNTFINWGNRSVGSSFLPSMSEINPANEIIWEIDLTATDNIISYRARKNVWDPCARPTFKKMKANNITAQSVKLKWAEVAGAMQYKIQYKPHAGVMWTEQTVNASKHFLNVFALAPGTKYDWRIQTSCDESGTTTSGFTNLKKFTTLTQKFLLSVETPVAFIFPNPAHDQIFIKADGILKIRMLNLLGQEMQLQYAAEGELFRISVAGVPAGNYLLEISYDQRKEVRKVVLVH